MGGRPSIPSSFISKDIMTSANHRSSWSRLSCWILGECINELLPFLDENQRPSKTQMAGFTAGKKWNAVQRAFRFGDSDQSPWRQNYHDIRVASFWVSQAKGSPLGRSIKQWNSSMSKSRMNLQFSLQVKLPQTWTNRSFLVGFMSLKTRGCFFTQLDAWSSCMEPFLSLFVDKWRQIALDLQWQPCTRIAGDYYLTRSSHGWLVRNQLQLDSGLQWLWDNHVFNISLLGMSPWVWKVLYIFTFFSSKTPRK